MKEYTLLNGAVVRTNIQARYLITGHRQILFFRKSKDKAIEVMRNQSNAVGFPWLHVIDQETGEILQLTERMDDLEPATLPLDPLHASPR